MGINFLTMKKENWDSLLDIKVGNKINELDYKLKKKRFTYKQVQEIINKAQNELVNVF